MKNTHSIVTGVLAVAVIILFILQFTKGSKSGSTKEYVSDTSLVSKGVVRIRYVMSDSISKNWEFAKELLEIFKADQMVRQERVTSMENTLMAKQNALKREYSTLTDREIENRSIELQKLQEQYTMDAQDLEQKAMMQEQEINMRLADSLSVFFPIFAKKIGADMILNNSSIVKTVFYIDPALDVTQAAITELNARYKKSKPKDDTKKEDK